MLAKFLNLPVFAKCNC